MIEHFKESTQVHQQDFARKTVHNAVKHVGRSRRMEAGACYQCGIKDSINKVFHYCNTKYVINQLQKCHANCKEVLRNNKAQYHCEKLRNPKCRKLLISVGEKCLTK